MSGLKIIDPGLATSIQDQGRTGYLRFGVPVCGALDTVSMRLANALVGNEGHVPVLEMRFLGPSFEVTAEGARLAFCGAKMSVRIERDGDTIEINENRSVTVKTGDRLSVGALRGSSTACMAVEGGFATEPVLGSSSFDAKSAIGGFDGAKLDTGDLAHLNLANVPPRVDMALPGLDDEHGDDPIRVVMGPQDDYFTAEAIETFLSTKWTLSQQADRMGMRLEGPALEHAKGHDIASDGIANGAIQVPGSGRPIVLLADRQTSGGYPKVATVVSCDLPRLGRMAPGSTLRFEAVDAASSIELARSHEKRVRKLIDSVAPYHPPGEVDLEALASGNIISAPVGME